MDDFTVNLTLPVAATVDLLGSMYSSAVSVLAEFIDNSADANARKIWISLEDNRIIITDDGSGMLPRIPDEDQKLLDDFFSGNSQLDLDQDIRKLVSPMALKTLMWMGKYAVFSPKIVGQEANVKGTKGVGAIAWRYLARNAMWLTRATQELASAYWGDQFAEKLSPVYIYEPASEQTLAKQKHQSQEVTSRIYMSNVKLHDPEGVELESGTQVVIYDLKEGVLKALNPSMLSDYLSGRYGNEIRAGRYSITIVDRVTDEGRRTRGGRHIMVIPPEYRGYLIVNRDGFLKHGEHPFRIKIHYDSKGKSHKVKIIRKGVAVANLTDLAELANESPWNLGVLGGEVEFPDIDEDLAPWDSMKKLPSPSSVLSQWLKSLTHVGQEIITTIEEMESKKLEQAKLRRTRQVEQAVLAAMKDLPYLKNMTMFLPAPRLKLRIKDKKKGTTKVDPRTYVSVINEHRSPVRGVQIEVRKDAGKQAFMTLQTGMSGRVSLGVLPLGHYIITLIGEEKRNPEPKLYVFEIKKGKAAEHLYVFRVVTGELAPTPKKIRGISLWPHALDGEEAGKLFSLKRFESLGTIEINTEADDYRLALDSGDVDQQILLETLYTSMAITQYAFPNEPTHVVFSNISALFSRAYANVLRMSSHGQKK